MRAITLPNFLRRASFRRSSPPPAGVPESALSNSSRPHGSAAGEHYGPIRRRTKVAGIATRLGNHRFRATRITAYLKNGGTLEKAPR
jgi:hypothetical protein